MTPLITPPHMRPLDLTRTPAQTVKARCPVKQCDVEVDVNIKSGGRFFCGACAELHRVYIDSNGNRTLSCL